MFIKDNELHIVWCVEDVMQRAKAEEIYVSKEEAEQCLHIMLDRHDCNYGITWESVSAAIETVIEERGHNEET